MAKTTPLHRATALGLLGLTTFTIYFLVPRMETWATPSSLILGAIVCLGAVLAAWTLWTNSPHRRTVGALTLVGGAVLILAQLFKLAPAFGSPGPWAYDLIVIATASFAGLGTLRRLRTARWLAIGMGGVGLLSSGSNFFDWVRFGWASPTTFTLALGTVGSAIILLTLWGSSVAATDKRGPSDQVWSQKDSLVFWMRAGSITAFGASLMCVVYAYGQVGSVASLTAPTTALAVVLAVAAILSMRGLTVGGLLLAIAAAGLIATLIAVSAQTAEPMNKRLTLYYGMFWVPAAVCGMATGLTLWSRTRRKRLSA